MPEHKSHHYVPQMYMRLFSTDVSRVGVFVIKSRKFIPHAPIRGQACRDYFYGKDPWTERAFGTIEGHAAKIFADAVEHHRLPSLDSEALERLIFFLGIQHSRTMSAAEQHNEGSVKAVKAMLRRQAEIEGNDVILDNIDKVRITRTNAVSEVVRYATIGANLLADLTFVLVSNESDIPFVASDAPVVLHNRLYEGQHISVTGYANVGLQLFLPLGPRLALLGYDAAAYDVRRDGDGIVRLQNPDHIRLINDLQWEAAHAVLLVAPDMPEDELQARATHRMSRRQPERVVFRKEVINRSETEVRTRQGGGQAPSAISLDLPFIMPRLPPPPRLGPYEAPPFRDPARVGRTDRAFAAMDELDERRRLHG
jgi:hypothetical protein